MKILITLQKEEAKKIAELAKREFRSVTATATKIVADFLRKEGK